MPIRAFTIAKLARSAGVGVEAVRYYQRRGLLSSGTHKEGGFREYSQTDVQRLRFIKNAQELGFSLDAIAELTSLSAEQDQLRVREITQRRMEEIRQRVIQLEAMATALQSMVLCCEQSASSDFCPIIAALTALDSLNTGENVRASATWPPSRNSSVAYTQAVEV